MERNIKVKKTEDSIVINYYNGNGIGLLIIYVCLLLIYKITLYFLSIFNVKISDLAYGIYHLIGFLTFLDFLSILYGKFFDPFERLTITKNLIILEQYYLPWTFYLKRIGFINNYDTKISYLEFNDWKRKSMLYDFFPSLYRKYTPLDSKQTNRWKKSRYIKNPDEARAMHFVNGDDHHAFGTMMPKESYDEILALILAQRAKWEKEHPEDAIAPEPEDSETHTVDSSSQ